MASVADIFLVIYVMLGLTMLIAIIALVFGTTTYTQMQRRNARRDAFFYAIGQNAPLGKVVVLFVEELDVPVEPGTSATITNLALADDVAGGVTQPVPAQIVLTVAKTSAGSNTGSVTFAGTTTQFTMPSHSTTFDVVHPFMITRNSSTPQPVVLANTGTVSIAAATLRVTTVPRSGTN